MRVICILLAVFLTGCSTAGKVSVVEDTGPTWTAEGDAASKILNPLRDKIIDHLRTINKEDKPDIMALLAATLHTYLYIATGLVDATEGSEKGAIIKAEVVRLVDQLKDNLKVHMGDEKPSI